MPKRSYIPIHDPPWWWEKVFAHLFMLSASLASIVSGLLLLMSAFVPRSYVVSKALVEAPMWQMIITAIALFVGGSLVFLSMFLKFPDIQGEFLTERVGCLVVSGGWFIYFSAIIVWADKYDSTISVSSGLTLVNAMVFFARFWISFQVEAALYRTVKKYGDTPFGITEAMDDVDDKSDPDDNNKKVESRLQVSLPQDAALSNYGGPEGSAD